MSSVKLKHSSGNGTIINGPVANPSADITLKVPSTTGTAGQVLKVASANHSATNAELEWGTGSSNEFAKVKLDGTTNSSKAAGDFWYQSSDGKFYFAGTATGAWSTGGSIASARGIGSGNGTLYAGLITSGWQGSSYLTSVEEYNGTSWSSKTSCSTASYGPFSIGSTTATLKYGGYTGSYIKTSEEYDGSAWSAGGSCIATVGMSPCGAGTQTAGLSIGGRSGSSTYLASCEKYDGASWSSTASLSGNRYNMSSGGTQTAAISAGGYDGSTRVNTTEEFDGTAWSAGGNMAAGKNSATMGGVQLNFIVSNGNTNSANWTNTTELYNGTTWSAGPTAIYSLSATLSGGGGGNCFTGGGVDASAYRTYGQEFETTIDTMLKAEVI